METGQSRKYAERVRKTVMLWLLAATASAQAGVPEGSGPSVERSVIAGGGGTSSGGTFTIQGTIGQSDADPLQPSSGGNFSVTGGFWASPSTLNGSIFANGFENP